MWNKESGEVSDVDALTSWDKRTFNSIVVEGDDQRYFLSSVLLNKTKYAFFYSETRDCKIEFE